MPFWSRLFGVTPAEPPASAFEEHKGFRVTPRPRPEGGQHRVAARIEKDGRVHAMVRADTCASPDDARALSLAKAKAMIDEQGERLFG